MNQDFFKNLSGKLAEALKQTKTIFSRDYSVEDLKKIGALPAYLRKHLHDLRAPANRRNNDVIPIKAPWSAKRVIDLMINTITHYRRQCIGLLVLGILLVVNTFLIAPYVQQLQDQLGMRPAQWSALQSLVGLSKRAAASQVPLSSSSLSGLERISGVVVLDEMEMLKLRNLLTTRGMKPNVLRLTADNPPQIEFQASEVMFSVLLDVLEELRTGWRLYPERLNVISSGGTGVVNISGTLMQYGRQFEAVQ